MSYMHELHGDEKYTAPPSPPTLSQEKYGLLNSSRRNVCTTHYGKKYEVILLKHCIYFHKQRPRHREAFCDV